MAVMSEATDCGYIAYVGPLVVICACPQVFTFFGQSQEVMTVFSSPCCISINNGQMILFGCCYFPGL